MNQSSTWEPNMESITTAVDSDDILRNGPKLKKNDDVLTFSGTEDIPAKRERSKGRKDDVLTFAGSTSSRGAKNPLTKEGRQDIFSESSSRAISGRLSKPQIRGTVELSTRIPMEQKFQSVVIPVVADRLISKERKLLKVYACLCGITCGGCGIFFSSNVFESLGEGRFALALVVCVMFVVFQVILIDRSIRKIELSGPSNYSRTASLGRRQSMCLTKIGTTPGESIVTLPRSQGELHDTILSGIYDDDTSTCTQRVTTAGSETGSDSFSSRSHSVLKVSSRSRRKRQLDYEEYRKASVVIVGMKTRATGPGCDAFVAHLTVLMQQIVEITTKHNGTPHALLGEKVVLSFNTATDNASHQHSANLTALFLANSTQNNGHVSVGVACGKVLCGTLGCESLRNYSVCGEPVCRATTLEKMALVLKVSILADQEIRRSCIDLMVFRFADSIASSTSEGPPESIFQLLANKAFNSKEWMYYETPYDQGAEYLLAGDYVRAEASFTKYLLASPNDDNAIRLMSFAQAKKPPPYSTGFY